MKKEFLRDIYCKKDSGAMFLLTLLLPQLVTFAIYMLVGSICLNSGMSQEQFDNSTIATIVQYLGIQLTFFAIFFVYNRYNKINYKTACKISFQNIDIKKIAIVLVISFICLFGLNELSKMLQYLLINAGYMMGGSLDLSSPILYVVSLLLVAVCPAIFEELTMRGVVLNGLKDKNSTNKSVFLSAFIFMLLHLSLSQSVYQFVLGVVLGFVAVYSGNLLYSIILHFVNNATIITDGFINYGKTVELGSYNTFMDYFLPILIAVVSLVVVYLLLILLKKISSKQTSEELNIVHENCEKVAVNEGNKQTNSNLEEQNGSIFGSFNVCLIIGIVLWVVSVLMGFMGVS